MRAAALWWLAALILVDAGTAAAQQVQDWDVPQEVYDAATSGDYRKALRLAQAALDRCRAANPADERPCARLWLGVSGQAYGVGDQVLGAYAGKVYDSFGIDYKRDSLALANARWRRFADRAVSYSAAEDDQRAKEMYQLAMLQAVSEHGPESVAAGVAYGNLGRHLVYRYPEEATRGTRLLRRAIGLIERCPELDQSNSLIFNLSALAGHLEKYRLYDLAERYRRRLVQLADSGFGRFPASDREWQRSRLVYNLRRQGKFADMERVQRELMQLRVGRYVPDSYTWYSTYADLADALAGQRKWAEARTYYRIGTASARRAVAAFERFDSAAERDIRTRRPVFRGLVRANWALAAAARTPQDAGLPPPRRGS
ncbi:hypothetical protein [Sphingomonas sp. CCH9-E2]|uniref:hypothetical protein n=1 Tax=Sphingomonas sp. CCH9-E2 TaxID=1768776 RepID=UPI000832C289|nr:hypothetical protein [Sphingomonas sp. CCH9-E2]